MKEISIKNRTYYYLLKIDKKSYKHINIYCIGYVTKKDSKYVNIHSVNPLYFIVDKLN